MKWILFIALFLLPLLSFAQRGGGLRNLSADSLATLTTERMRDSLSLSSAQVDRVYQVNLDFEQRKKNMRKEANGDWQSMRGKMTEMRNEHSEAMSKFLTADQMNDWKRIQIANREKMKAARMERGGKGPRDRGSKNKEGESKEKTELKINN